MKLPAFESLSRRAALGALATLAAVSPTAPAHAISATTMSGKTKADLGIILASETTTVGKQLLADLVLDGGVVATTTFDSKWPLAEGNYYDFEAATRDGDTAFCQVMPLAKGESLASLPKTWFVNSIFGVDGRYGAYGAPTDVKLKEMDKEEGKARSFDVSFTVLSPSMAELQRKGVIRALQPPGSNDVLLLTASSSATRWAKTNAESEARAIQASFRVTATKPTDLKREAAADYRFGKTTGPSSMKSRNDGF